MTQAHHFHRTRQIFRSVPNGTLLKSEHRWARWRNERWACQRTRNCIPIALGEGGNRWARCKMESWACQRTRSCFSIAIAQDDPLEAGIRIFRAVLWHGPEVNSDSVEIVIIGTPEEPTCFVLHHFEVETTSCDCIGLTASKGCKWSFVATEFQRLYDSRWFVGLHPPETPTYLC